jgi:uncharacterized protein (TIGR01777 family)
MRIAITGASGLIGTALATALSGAGHDLVRLVRQDPAGPDEARWDIEAGQIDEAAQQEVRAIVHLAGENVGQRWTAGARDRILGSRVQGTRLIAETAARLPTQPALLCASAVGYYGVRGDEVLDESAARGTGFLADVVEAWEGAAAPAREAGLRVVHMRQGLVLSRHGGALQRMLLPFKLGTGGRIGSGHQWWSWVSLDDVVSAYLFALERPLQGAVNVAAPGAVRNEQFVKALGRALHRPAVFPLPAVAVRTAFGEMGEEMLLGGQRVLPAKLEDAGFVFGQPDVDSGLAHALAG